MKFFCPLKSALDLPAKPAVVAIEEGQVLPTHKVEQAKSGLPSPQTTLARRKTSCFSATAHGCR